MSSAGFEAVDLEPTRIYRAADAKQFLEEAGLSDDATIAQIDGWIMSAFVRARKPRPRRVAADQPAVRRDGEFGNRPARPESAETIEGQLLTTSLGSDACKPLIRLALQDWLAALDDLRNWLIGEAA